MSLEDKIKKIIAQKLEVDENEVVPDASFVNDLGADSLTLVELVMELEDQFDLDISDEESEKLEYVRDAIEYITSHC